MGLFQALHTCYYLDSVTIKKINSWETSRNCFIILVYKSQYIGIFPFTFSYIIYTIATTFVCHIQFYPIFQQTILQSLSYAGCR